MARESIPLQVVVNLDGFGERVFQDEEWAGTKGEARRLEGCRIRLKEPRRKLGLRYMAHIENIGDTEWTAPECEGAPDAEPDCAFVGTRGPGLRLEGFAIECTGRAKDKFHIAYAAHVADQGDIGPFRDGEFCGTRGEARRIEAIWVRLRKRRE